MRTREMTELLTKHYEQTAATNKLDVLMVVVAVLAVLIIVAMI